MDIDTIRIDGMDYTIETQAGESKLGLAYSGAINLSELEIVIKDAKPAVWLQTLLHEILHHIGNYRLRDDLSEAQIDAIATAINSLLLDNPDLALAYWQVSAGEALVEEECQHAD